MTRIELTFLGTTAGIPTKKRSHAAVHLKYNSENEFNYLFDCGEGTQRQILLAGLNFMRINEIFITHWHADHFAGLLGLIETMGLEGRTKPLRIYAPEADNFVPMLMNLGYSTKNFNVIPVNVEHEGNVISKIMETPEFEILSVPVEHGIPAVAYGFKEKDRVNIDKKKSSVMGLPKQGPIYKKLKKDGHALFKGNRINLEDICTIEKGKKIVYSGDTIPCSNMIKFAKNADIMIHDSTFFEDLKRRHASVSDVIKIAKKAGVKRTILTHFSRRYQNPKELQDRIKNYPNLTLAKDFMKIVLK